MSNVPSYERGWEGGRVGGAGFLCGALRLPVQHRPVMIPSGQTSSNLCKLCSRGGRTGDTLTPGPPGRGCSLYRSRNTAGRQAGKVVGG